MNGEKWPKTARDFVVRQEELGANGEACESASSRGICIHVPIYGQTTSHQQDDQFF